MMRRLTSADIASDQQVLLIMELWRDDRPVSDTAKKYCLRIMRRLCRQRLAEFQSYYAAKVSVRDDALCALHAGWFSHLSDRTAGDVIAERAHRYKRTAYSIDKRRGQAPAGDREQQLFFDVCRSTDRIPKGATIAKIIARNAKKRQKPNG